MTANELDIIGRVRGEVHGNVSVTGENLFLVWGYPTAVFLFLEFLALIWLKEDWCSWIWMGIPLVAAPLMIYFLYKDYARTHRRTHDQSVILFMWVFIGFASAIGGFSMGLAGVFQQFYCAFQGLLCGLGCFVTGLILHFRPKTVCGIVASALSVAPLFFQGALWPWQLLITAVVAVVSLIVPGHLFRRYVRGTYQK